MIEREKKIRCQLEVGGKFASSLIGPLFFMTPEAKPVFQLISQPIFFLISSPPLVRIVHIARSNEQQRSGHRYRGASKVL